MTSQEKAAALAHGILQVLEQYAEAQMRAREAMAPRLSNDPQLVRAVQSLVDDLLDVIEGKGAK